MYENHWWSFKELIILLLLKDYDSTPINKEKKDYDCTFINQF
jgi:hypothetical protein